MGYFSILALYVVVAGHDVLENDLYDNVGNVYSTVCHHCCAFKFEGERKGFCCEKGRVAAKMQPAPELPPEIEALYTYSNYLNNIRTYNNSMAMASLGCTEVKCDGFNPSFKIHGKVYHQIGSLLPNPEQQPVFAQIYFHDPEHEVENRVRGTCAMRPDILEILMNSLKTHNNYVKHFKTAIDFMSRTNQED